MNGSSGFSLRSKPRVSNSLEIQTRRLYASVSRFALKQVVATLVVATLLPLRLLPFGRCFAPPKLINLFGVVSITGMSLPYMTRSRAREMEAWWAVIYYLDDHYPGLTFNHSDIVRLANEFVKLCQTVTRKLFDLEGSIEEFMATAGATAVAHAVSAAENQDAYAVSWEGEDTIVVSKVEEVEVVEVDLVAAEVAKANE